MMRTATAPSVFAQAAIVSATAGSVGSTARKTGYLRRDVQDRREAEELHEVAPAAH